MADRSGFTADTPATIPISVVGLHGGAWFGARALDALRRADVIVGTPRLFREIDATGCAPFAGEPVHWGGSVPELIDLLDERHARHQQICVLASGDPGFFGIERLLVGRFGTLVEVHPAPSSVALALARVQLPWDDAVVVSCHGRSLDLALPHILAAPKVAVLVSPATPPEAVGRALLEADPSTPRFAAVCSRLGQAEETITTTDLTGLAEGTFDPLSVLVLTTSDRPVAPEAVVSWGRPVSSFAHRANMVTKPEVRAVVLSKLELFGAATLWDVGAASGSVGIEAAHLVPGLRVYAVEQNPEDAERIRSNGADMPVSVIVGRAPAALADLPTPDRVFVGGGGLDVLDTACLRISPGGMVAATYAVMETALAAVDRLGPGADLVQIQVNRAKPIGPNHHLRLEADNPVFVVWGSPQDPGHQHPNTQHPNTQNPNTQHPNTQHPNTTGTSR